MRLHVLSVYILALLKDGFNLRVPLSLSFSLIAMHSLYVQCHNACIFFVNHYKLCGARKDGFPRPALIGSAAIKEIERIVYILNIYRLCLRLPKSSGVHETIRKQTNKRSSPKWYRQSRIQGIGGASSSLEVLVEQLVHLALVPVVLGRGVLRLARYHLVVFQLGLQLALPILFYGGKRQFFFVFTLMAVCAKGLWGAASSLLQRRREFFYTIGCSFVYRIGRGCVQCIMWTFDLFDWLFVKVTCATPGIAESWALLDLLS